MIPKFYVTEHISVPEHSISMKREIFTQMDQLPWPASNEDNLMLALHYHIGGKDELNDILICWADQPQLHTAQ
jgi:hypothetical protein